MKLVIHRGTHEIGGTCVEIATDETRIIIDLGMPLADPRDKKKKLNEFSLTGKTVPELIVGGILPRVSGLYRSVGEEKLINAVLLSHPHQDHYGFFKYIREDIRIYLGEDTDLMLQASEALLGDRFGRHEDKVLMRDREPVSIGDIKVTPFVTDHSGYGAMAFLVEAEGKKIFYSGDFRGHGRKKALFEQIVSEQISGVNALLMEGTMMGRQNESTLTEDELELEIVSEARVHDGMKLFICSGQNVDRLVTFYRAAKRSGAILVLDLYAANILHELGRKTLPLPTNGFKDVQIFFTKQLMKRLLERNLKGWYERWRPYEISPGALQRAGKKAFVMFRDSSVHELEVAGIPKGSVLFYSLWSQYTLEPSFERTQGFMDRHGIELKEMHTSGHAVLPDLKRFAESMDPEVIIPIHTEYPERYREHFGNKVRCLRDGETLAV
jgi:ribonuclease J